MRRAPTLVFLLIAALVAGCASPRYATKAFVDNLNAPYVLNAGDRLRVLVFGQENLSNIYAVDASGRIAMPLIGAVPAAGLTTEELEAEVGRRLQNGFLREPNVSIEIEQYRPFFILGEVVQGGQFAFVNGITVQSAIAIAGGFTPRADRLKVEVARNIGGQVVVGLVPLTHPIRPGDTITVLERWF